MSNSKNDISLDLSLDNITSKPIIGWIQLVLHQAIKDGADQISFSLLDEPKRPLPKQDLEILKESKEIADLLRAMKETDNSSENDNKFHVEYFVNGIKKELSPAPSQMFSAVITALCNYASVPYYAKGPVEGKISVVNPDLILTLKSEDLKKGLTLLRDPSTTLRMTR